MICLFFVKNIGLLVLWLLDKEETIRFSKKKNLKKRQIKKRNSRKNNLDKKIRRITLNN